MSVQQAQQWLENHTHSIPALGVNQTAIVRLLDDDMHKGKLIPHLENDPAMIMALLCKVNIQRHPDSGKAIVESPQAAMTLLGDQVSATLLKHFAVAEDNLREPHQLFLYQQLINRSLHNRQQAMGWADRLGYHQSESTAISAMLAYIGELLCCVHDFKKYFTCISDSNPEQAIVEGFGFSFDQLTEAVCQSRNLPEHISQSLASSEHRAPKNRLIGFTSGICRLSERGWYHDGMHEILQRFAEFLRLPVDDVIRHSHQYAIDAARSSSIAEAWQPASRLLLVADGLWSAETQSRPGNTKASDQSSSPQSDKTAFASRLKQQLQSPDLKQKQLLHFCMQSLYQDLEFSRVCVMTLSNDKSWLLNRLAFGIDDSSPLTNFRIETERSGLFKMLLKQPQGILVDEANLKKYQKLVPQRFLASILTNNFVAMSLFIGSRPVAIVFADRSSHHLAISASQYQQFKQFIGLTSKALTLLAKRQQSVKA